MAPALSKLKFADGKVVFAASSLASLLWFARLYSKSKARKRQDANPEIRYIIEEKKKKREKAQISLAFVWQLRRILKIIIPKWYSVEAGYMASITLLLMLRSLCDIFIISLGTQIESSIIQQNNPLFKKHLTNFALTMPLMSLVNNLLKYTINKLKLRYRKRLTEHLCQQYLTGLTYYRMNNIDNRIANPDQLLTTDVEKFCNSFADLYSSISKPFLDILIYVKGLTSSIGGKTPSIMILYLLFAGVMLSRVHRPVGRFTMNEQKLEGEFRYVNSRLITNSEEVAFYQGNSREKLTVLAVFRKLINHLENFVDLRFYLGYLDNIVAKYFATVVGYYAVSRPFLSKSHHLSSITQSKRLEEYYRNGRMLVRLAEAIGKLVLAVWELTRLAGYTARVTELMRVLKELNEGRYECSLIRQKNGLNGTGLSSKDESVKENSRTPISLVPGSGNIIICDNLIRFEKVPLVTPNGDVLIEELNFQVESGVNVLVCGPNGCGKSSLFRLLGELWPLFGGTLVKPPQGKLFYIPQRPYMTLGTLRDQVIYPDSHEEMVRKGMKDADLIQFLDVVQLGYLLEREGGWDAVADWMDVLSGGEKQRIAMARLFYQKPQFAILDECTSAVSVDVEGSMYRYCRKEGITLFTVSHRKSLWEHHEYYLYMDGRGSYQFKKIDADTEEFGS